MDSPGKLLSKAISRFQSLPPTRRLAVTGVAALVVIAIGILVNSRTALVEREYLYGGREFSRDEIIAIETAFGDASLEGWKVVGYRIEIPTDTRASFLAALGKAGFQPGMEIAAEKGGIFDSESDRKMRAKREKQQKMAKLVERMPGIEEVAVEFTESKSSGFPRTVEKRAAVAVKAVGGRHLDLQEVAAIQSVIFASEAGLPTENVVVLDINAKRTYDGAKDASDMPVQHAVDKQKKLYEDRLRQQIRNRLVNYPGLIVEVRAQPAVTKNQDTEGGQDGFFPRGIAVSIGVPSSYYERLWKKHYGAAATRDERSPTRFELAEIESQTLRKVEEIVRGLLNEIDLPDQRQPNIVVRTDEDFATAEQVAQQDSPRLWTSLSERGQPLLFALLALAVVVGWLVLSRQKKKAAGEVKATEAASETPINARKTADALGDVNLEHAQVPALEQPADDLQDQLSRLVQSDPDAAVDALRKWIRKVA